MPRLMTAAAERASTGLAAASRPGFMGVSLSEYEWETSEEEGFSLESADLPKLWGFLLPKDPRHVLPIKRPPDPSTITRKFEAFRAEFQEKSPNFLNYNLQQL